MPRGYTNVDFEPWARGIRGIGTMLMEQPALRAQGQLRQQQAALAGARTGAAQAQGEEYRARAGKTDAETQELLYKGQLVKALEQWGPQAQQDLVAGNGDSEAVQHFTGAASALTGVNKGDIQKSLRTGIGTILARKGQVQPAAEVDNPNAAFKTEQDNATRQTIAERLNASREKIDAAKPVVAGNGATSMYRNGNVIAKADYTLRQGESRFPGQNTQDDGADAEPDADPDDGGLARALASVPGQPKSAATDAVRAKLAADLVRAGSNTIGTNRVSPEEALS